MRPMFKSNKFIKLSKEDSKSLKMRFSKEEIWRAVRGCGSSKVSGSDGFNFRFIKRYWKVIKGEVIRA